jgi:hypothetical protein
MTQGTKGGSWLTNPADGASGGDQTPRGSKEERFDKILSTAGKVVGIGVGVLGMAVSVKQLRTPKTTGANNLVITIFL